MNPGIRLCTALAVLAVFLVAGPASAQIEDNLGGLTAGNTERYLEPLPAAFSGALNTAIFRTGDIPKAGLTVQFGVEAMIVAYDDGMKSYSPTLPEGFTPADPNAEIAAPTVIGNGEAITVDGEGGLQVHYPGGFDIENFAVAVPQLTVGNFMGTRATIRYVALDLGDVEIGDLELIGFGLQHSLTQYLVMPGPKPVDVAVGFFYQSFKLGNDFIKSNALHLNATASRSFGIFQPYVGVGFDSYGFEVNYMNDLDEKVKVEFDNENSMHLTLGGAAGFGLAHVHAELNIASAIGIAAGLSVGL